MNNDKIEKKPTTPKTRKPSVRVLSIEDLQKFEPNTSETAKAVLKIMRKTHQKLYGGKAKVKSA